MKTKLYLGDSVYAERDSDTGHITLTVENGVTEATEMIHLNRDVQQSLARVISGLHALTT